MKWKLRLTVIISLLLLELSGVVYLNFWRNGFYNSIEVKDSHSFMHYFEIFAIVAMGLITVMANRAYFTQSLALHCRVYFTKLLQNKWCDKWKSLGIENGAQRINQDISDFFTIGFTLGSTLIQSLLTVIIFSFVIYYICIDKNFNVLWIYAASYSYAIVGTIISYYTGRSLVKSQFDMQQKEADHRFGLVSVSHDVNDKQHDERIDSVKTIGLTVLKQQKVLSFVTNGFGQIQVLIPFLIMAPFYFKGLIGFGFLFQISQSIDLLQQNLSCIINSYPQITQFQSTLNRVKFLRTLL